MRYPILHKLKDRLNQTWYQIRIGDRLAYISALDAQPDNGLSVLTYHQILRDEENTVFAILRRPHRYALSITRWPGW
ncbi:hypothetical protein ACNKHU_00890 [Shigella flexneri]